MTQTRIHFDHVGSYLRPSFLKEARQAYENGEIAHTDLLKTQDQAVSDLVERQVKSGLKVVSDGEFGRSWWHLDFLWGLNGVEPYTQEESYRFHGAKTRTTNVRLTGKLSANAEHPFFRDFNYLKSITPDGIIPKVTIPSPFMLLRDHRSDHALDYYETWTDYLNGLADTYHDTIQHFYDLGARYVQIDDTSWAYLIDRIGKHPNDREKYDKLGKDAVYTINRALSHLPDDLTLATHICRGNFKSTYLFEGSYQAVAPYLAQLNYDRFFLEYDNERSGDFSPLSTIWNDRSSVILILGLITSKDPELEDKDKVIARIKEASQQVPLENLGLSTQCGFASTEEGNLLTESDQWQKIALVKEIAETVW